MESGDFGGADNLYCKYSFSYGHDWTVVTGLDGVTAGLSQIAKKGSAGMDNTFGGSVVWNFPIDVAFKVGERPVGNARCAAANQWWLLRWRPGRQP